MLVYAWLSFRRLSIVANPNKITRSSICQNENSFIRAPRHVFIPSYRFRAPCHSLPQPHPSHCTRYQHYIALLEPTMPLKEKIKKGVDHTKRRLGNLVHCHRTEAAGSKLSSIARQNRDGGQVSDHTCISTWSDQDMF